MEYVNYLSDIVGTESRDTKILHEMVANNKVEQLLEPEGYRFAHVISADWYFYIPLVGMRFSNFTNYLLQTTALVPVCSYFIGSSKRDTTLGAFAILSDILNIRSPTFVFAHIYAPHPPFVFDRNGNDVKQSVFQEQGDVWEDKNGYIEQLIFINNKVRKLIDDILSRSDVEPIIILQADHGTACTITTMEGYSELSRSQLDERFGILNAYLFPQNGCRLLYDSITPVNSFRVMLNCCFGANMEVLEDESYFSSYSTPYELFRVP